MRKSLGGGLLPVEAHLKLKGYSEMTLLSAYITLTMPLLTPASHLTPSKNKHASVQCPARLHLLPPFPLPRSPACSARVPPASRRHRSHLACPSTMLCPARLHGRRVGPNLPGCFSLWRRPYSHGLQQLLCYGPSNALLRRSPHNYGRRPTPAEGTSFPLPSSQDMSWRCC